MQVVLVDRPGEALQKAAASIDGATALPADVADRAQMNELAHAVAARHGPVSMLLNNAGIGAGGDVFADPAAWHEVLGVNFLGVLNGVQAEQLVPHRNLGQSNALHHIASRSIIHKGRHHFGFMRLRRR